MFEHLGYFKEYWVGNKSIGRIAYCDKDRDVIGYEGRKKEVLASDVVLDNKITIKANTEVVTMIYPLQGKLKNKKR